MPRLKLSPLDLGVLAVVIVGVVLVVASAVLIQPPERVAWVAYLAPADASPQNIVAVNPNDPDAPPRQLTNSRYGIYDFSPDPTGRWIAYSEMAPGMGITEIWLYDRFNNTTRQVTNCLAEDATCDTPAWRVDGQVFAYQRRERNTQLGLGISPPRIWMMDLSTTPYNTFPLFLDSQTLGTEPSWSADGTRLAFYESFGQGILVFDFNALNENERVFFVPSDNGATGALSPDGRLLAYSELVFGGEGQSVRAVLYIADFSRNVSVPLGDPDDITDDGAYPAWHPDGTRLAFTRRYNDERRFTPGHQVYLYHLETGTVEPLIIDPNYNNGALFWSPDGGSLVIQRMAFGGGLPEIWTYNLETGALVRVGENGFLPRWLP